MTDESATKMNEGKKILEIVKYLNKIPEIFLNKKNYYFSRAINDAIVNFPFEENLDIRAYPWIKKINELLW